MKEYYEEILKSFPSLRKKEATVTASIFLYEKREVCLPYSFNAFWL